MSAKTSEFPELMTVTLNSPESLSVFGRNNVFDFRGQANSEWELETTLERHTNFLPATKQILDKAEFKMMESFKRQFDFFADSEPKPENQVEWLSALQHFGAPTRLLDFTESIYIAAYFAAVNTDSDSAIWALNRNHFIRNSDQPPNCALSIRHIEKRFDSLMSGEINGPHEPGVLPIVPSRINSRLGRQKGLFYVPISLVHTFAKNLAASINCRNGFETENWIEMEWDQVERHFRESAPSVKGMKIIIPRGFIPEIRRNLIQMNIGALTLFGGLEGLAKSVGESDLLPFTINDQGLRQSFEYKV